MSQEDTPEPSAPNEGPQAQAPGEAPSAPAAADVAPHAPEEMRAPLPLGPDQAASGDAHLVQPAEAAAQATGDAGESAPAHTDRPHRRRRRRRHRKGPPHDDGSSGAPAGAAPGGEGATVAAGASDGPSDGGGAGLHFSESGRPILSVPEAGPLPAAPGSPAQPGEHKRRRRRRHRGKRPEGAAPAQASGEASNGESAGAAAQSDAASVSEGGTAERPPRARFPRHRRRRDRRDGAGPRADGTGPREGGNDHAPREGASRNDRPRRDRDRGERGERERGPRDGKKRFGKKPGFGQGRDDRRPKEPPKLYSFESIVDRGFEDLPDPANDGATRRVDWQIVKRTVADQKSAKPVSSVYLLRREGSDTDFANLAAARQAVNKTIVHPEKLTRPKADYPSTKK